ncbi:hypothetical protein Z043_107566 [Scleropages formosus]|uniref:Uncharacterized protein n=1 Tax=Scleropages formosus TaxID=113540 RepID=A0A0P7UTZ5_SCLFO|nr:hypothetical protein Z043_107566 [Scleropages formosus]
MSAGVSIISARKSCGLLNPRTPVPARSERALGSLGFLGSFGPRPRPRPRPPCALQRFLCFVFQDMFSKGFVHISAVSNVRSVGDNKFEVVTSQRVFVFRVEKEGKDRISYLHKFSPPGGLETQADCQ